MFHGLKYIFHAQRTTYIVLSNRFSSQTEQCLPWRHPFEGKCNPVIIVTALLLRLKRTILWSTKDMSILQKRDLEHKELCLIPESTTNDSNGWTLRTRAYWTGWSTTSTYLYTCSNWMMIMWIRLLYLLD